jgi:adenosylmethionine-8-amino-7-oxononanoate aminotransferase
MRGHGDLEQLLAQAVIKSHDRQSRRTRLNLKRFRQCRGHLAGENFHLSVFGGLAEHLGDLLGDHVLLAPPFIVNEAQVNVIVDRLGDSIDAAITSVKSG